MSKTIKILIYTGLFGAILLIGSAKTAWAGTCGSSGDSSGSTHCTGATPWTADSLSWPDVDRCVNTCAAHGDTINLPAGNATWNSVLDLNKAVSLIGAGVTTVITSSKQAVLQPAYPDCGSYDSWNTFNHLHNDENNIIIRVKNPTLQADIDGFKDSGHITRISNMKIIGSGTVQHFLFTNNGPDYFNYRFDHLTMTNCMSNPLAGTTVGAHTIGIVGSWNGVIDNNNISGNPIFKIGGRQPSYINNIYYRGLGYQEYLTQRYAYPESKFNYVENNVITYNSQNTTSIYLGRAGTYGPPLINSVGWGAYAVFRYNNISINSDNEIRFNKNHGIGPELLGARGMEIYGNLYTATGNAGIETLADIEAGRNMVFFNKMRTDKSNPSMYLALYYPDTNYSFNLGNCPATGADYLYPSSSRCSLLDAIPVPLHPNRTYFWRNRNNDIADGSGYLFGSAGVSSVIFASDRGAGKIPVENQHWFKDNTSCSGQACSAGVGCGTTLPSSCTTGTGYWMTSQSCDNLTGYIGANPTNPISGTLYRCASTNNWQVYYTPYTYPHPLRGGTTNTAPAVPIGVRAI